MKFFEAVSTCFRKYADFSGRARRSEYWYFYLFNTIVTTVLNILPAELGIIATIYSLATLLPALAVTWRRMHDIGKNGAWSLIALIPLVGWILTIIWECRDSQPGENIYGPNPKA